MGLTGDDTEPELILGNESMARGALEGGVSFATGYPGTPSSEIIEYLAKDAYKSNIYVEWSANEKVAAEASGAAAISGMRSLVAMKNAGLSVALDFLTHLSLTGLGEQKGAMVVIVCDDPDAHSSGDETDSRWLSRFAYAPLLEPSSVQEANALVKWALDLSENFKCYILVRGYTRLCHASSMVSVGRTRAKGGRIPTGDTSRSLTPYLAKPKHLEVLTRLKQIKETFELAPFNVFEGPENAPLLVVTSGSGYLCSKEAIRRLGLEHSVAILKIATLWPFPNKLLEQPIRTAEQILVVEEVDPFIETMVKEFIVDGNLVGKRVLGKHSGHIPEAGEITPDHVLDALASITGKNYDAMTPSYRQKLVPFSRRLLLNRGLTWCPGCPHRASFFALERAVKKSKRDVYVTGDIGCYTLDVFPEGKGQMKALHAMGSGSGLAAGFGQLKKFGCEQPVISICGDSTFFHASIPALVNAIHNQADLVQIILDNETTAMTGFQPHPGTSTNAMGSIAKKTDLESICSALGCSVQVADPFDLKGVTEIIRDLIRGKEGVRVLILRRQCELLRMKTEKAKPFEIRVNEDLCRGAKCGICYGSFRCPALVLDPTTEKVKLKTDSCAGCGVCIDICPFSAISKS